MNTIIYVPNRYAPHTGAWEVNPELDRGITDAELLELKHRNALRITPQDIPGTPEFLAHLKWQSEAPEREAAEKKAKDIAAKTAKEARKAKREAIILSVSNTYPGISGARRTTINNELLSNYTKNYVLSGAGGLGKTTVLKAIARLNALDGKQVLWTTGMGWERDLRNNYFADFEDKTVLPISGEGLEHCRPVTICFDECESVNRTEFVLNEFVGLLNTAVTNRHQVVMTTNFTQTEFKEKFGASVYWRILQASESGGRGGLGCAWVNFNE